MIRKKISKLNTIIVPVEIIERRIYVIREMKVMIDSDLAELYEVTTGNLNLAVKRNSSRFPDDFMFQLTEEEYRSLVLQAARTKNGRGGRQTFPYVFTEQGVAMLATILTSDRAVQMNILIIRAFVKLREMIVSNKDLAHKIKDLERHYNEHDTDIQTLFKAIKKLLEAPALPPEPPRKPIGFRTTD